MHLPAGSWMCTLLRQFLTLWVSNKIWIRISELAIGISTTMCLKILTKKSEGKRKRKKKTQQSATYDAMMHYALCIAHLEYVMLSHGHVQ